MDLEETVSRAVKEDLGEGDITTRAILGDGSAVSGSAEIRAKQAGVLCGGAVLHEVFRQVDPDLAVSSDFDDGDILMSGDRVFTIRGRLAGILVGERTALNFLQRLSGIATETAAFVRAVEGTSARICDTRKTTPTFRALEKLAVTAGGGENHRFGLYDMMLIKENHIEAAGGVRPALEAADRYIRNGASKIRVEIETRNAGEVEEVLESFRAGCYIHRIMLDNMPSPEMGQMVGRIRSVAGDQIEIEASGGVSLETVRGIAETGVDLISVGALTHSPRAFDFSLIFV